MLPRWESNTEGYPVNRVQLAVAPCVHHAVANYQLIKEPSN